MKEAVLLDFKNEANIEVNDQINAQGWKPESASNYLNENSDLLNEVDAIMCGNDSIASQVVYSLSEHRLPGKAYVVGQDAELEACQRIVEGTQLMTVYKPVEKLAQKAAEYTVLLIRGEDFLDASTIYDGAYDVPYVALNSYAVYKTNMVEVIIDSGCHIKEDVYLNVKFD